MSGLEVLAVSVFGLLVLIAFCGGAAQLMMLVRLRNYHHEEWEAVLGSGPTDVLFANHKVLFYAFGRRWESLGDERVAGLALFVRRSTLVAWLLLLGFLAMAVTLIVQD